MNTALTPYIECALLTRHYCYVPGLGAFMSREIPGRMSASAGGTYQIDAPRREVTFNARMTHDDGELTVLVAQGQGIAYSQAEAFVRQEVAAIRRALAQQGGICGIGIVGQLYYDRSVESGDEELRFRPAVQRNLAESCGLADLTVPTWRQLERERNARRAAAMPNQGAAAEADVTGMRADRGERIHISIPRRWLRHVAVVVLIVCAFFASPLPSDHLDSSEYASMPLTALQTFRHLNTLVWQSWDERWESTTVYNNLPDPAAELDGMASVDPLADDADDTETQSDEAVAPSAPEAPASDTAPAVASKRYCIIVRSSANRLQIEAELGALLREGHDKAAVLERDGRFRLSIETFDAKDEALRYLEALRGRQGYADAWLLPVRQADLPSPIIKNPHNDGNQLSMELSHPKHRTVSDKG